MQQRALFVTFEGGEGAGKTTLIDKILRALHAHALQAIKTRAPGGTHLGEAIRHLLLDKRDERVSARCELFLFLADRAQHVEQLIAPALKNKQIVLCDRYNDSTVAYQGGARHIDAAEVRRLCDFACNHLQPDLTLYLDLDPAIGLARVGHSKDRIESEALQFHADIRAAFHEIARDEPQRFHILDASAPPQHVFEQAMQLVNKCL